MHRMTALFLSLCIACVSISCTRHTSQSSIPDNATFCDDITQQVQSLEQLHIASGTTQLHNSTSDVYKPIQYDSMYAMWFPVMDYAETLRGKSAKEFRSIMRTRFEKAAAMGINTVFLHVRAYQDAYYPSSLFPMGESVDFDPLQIMLEEAHRCKLSAHAWINPMRGPTDEKMQAIDEKYTIKTWYNNPQKRGMYLVQSGNHWWLNPAYDEVRQYIVDGVEEIITNYEVDGIHIDDYFYPTTDSNFDSAAFSQSAFSSLSEFRLAQINTMVKQLYEAIHTQNPHLIFSISPQGTLSGNYDSQYADVKRWGKEAGYCDALIPQIYFGFENQNAPFSDTVSLWTSMVNNDAVSLVIGIGTHKFGKEDQWAGTGKNEWIEHLDIPERQVTFLMQLDSIGGIAIYDYSTTFSPDTQTDAMAQQVEAIGALLRQSE